MTVQEIFNETSLPQIEIQVLLEYVSGKERTYLIAHPELSLTKDQLRRWEELRDRAMSGEPIDYILNRKEFYGNRFYVDHRVLIPRPETEGLVKIGLEFLQEQAPREPGRLTILEVGTGSGAVIISLVKVIWRVYSFRAVATDISPDALVVAKHNALTYNVQGLIDFRQGRLFEPVSGEKFDLILANLPYLPTDESVVNKFEPQLALDGGLTGNVLNDQLLLECQDYLKPRGLVVYEDYGGEIDKIQSRSNGG